MESYKKHLSNLAYAYGYRQKELPITVGDEILILNSRGKVVAQDLVEDISDDAIYACGQWWYTQEYSFKKLEE
jgi:hypothetical protein